MIKECLKQNPDCPLKEGCRRSVGHHKYYPAARYVTSLEVEFRNLPENIEQRCVCIEVADQHLTPLKKPSVREMIAAVMKINDGMDEMA